MACSINDLLKHTLKQVTFTCPVKCNMVRQSEIKGFANKSSPYSLYLAEKVLPAFFSRSAIFSSFLDSQKIHYGLVRILSKTPFSTGRFPQAPPADFLPAPCSPQESPSLHLCSSIPAHGIYHSPSVLPHMPEFSPQ